MRRSEFLENPGPRSLTALCFLAAALTGCSESRTPVAQVSDALFAEGDSVFVAVRHTYVWWEESDLVSVGSDQEDGAARFLRSFPGGRQEILHEISGLGDRWPGLVQLQGDTLVYSIASTNTSSSVTHSRNLATGQDSSLRGGYRISRGGKYWVHENEVIDRASGAIMPELKPPRYWSIVLLDDSEGVGDAGPRMLVWNSKDGLGLWDPGAQTLVPLRPAPAGYYSWFLADGGEALVFREIWPKKGSLSACYFALVSDLLAGKKDFRTFAVDAAYRPVDFSVAEGSVLTVKRLGFDASDDTLRVFDLGGNLKRKIAI